MTISRSRGLAAALCVLVLRASASAQDATAPTDLTSISIEELMAVDVTSASKREQPAFQVPAAIYVITKEELRRSLSIPEALRLVPGLEVAQIDANKWSISARGFANRFANKLLVMIDGRIVYTSGFSGVYWDTQDLILEDVERIEVIRGPGAVLWGANAVNGVISIITKNSRDTQGGLVVAGAGNLETAFGALRYGADAGKGLTYRLFGKGQSRANNVLLDGSAGADAWRSGMVGLRTDLERENDSALFEGSLYRGSFGERDTQIESVQDPTPVLVERHNTFQGGNFTLGWAHRFSQRSVLSFSADYDSRHREETVVSAREHIVDLEIQHNLSIGTRQEVVWGLEFRRTTSDMRGTFQISFDPVQNAQNLISGFAQDDVTLVANRLHVIAGIKVESYSGNAPLYEPNVRMLWTPNSRETVWASIARAYRTPSLVDRGIRVNTAGFIGEDGVPVLVSVFGDPNIRPEKLLAYEAGYRVEPATSLSLDLAAFYNKYDDLIEIAATAPYFEAAPLPPHVVLPIRFVNEGRATTYGAELAANWNVLTWWRLRGAFSWLEMNLEDPTPESANSLEGDSPRFQANLRASFDLPHDLGLDVNVFYVDRNPARTSDAYTRVDFMALWRPLRAWEIAFGIRNLLDGRYIQAGSITDGLLTTITPRSIYGKVTWRF